MDARSSLTYHHCPLIYETISLTNETIGIDYYWFDYFGLMIGFYWFRFLVTSAPAIPWTPEKT